MLCSRSLLFVYFIYSNVYPLIPNSKFVPHLLSPLVIISLFSCLWVCFCFVNKFICIIFLDPMYKWYHMIFIIMTFLHRTKEKWKIANHRKGWSFTNGSFLIQSDHRSRCFWVWWSVYESSSPQFPTVPNLRAHFSSTLGYPILLPKDRVAV